MQRNGFMAPGAGAEGWGELKIVRDFNALTYLRAFFCGNNPMKDCEMGSFTNEFNDLPKFETTP